ENHDRPAGARRRLRPARRGLRPDPAGALHREPGGDLRQLPWHAGPQRRRVRRGAAGRHAERLHGRPDEGVQVRGPARHHHAPAQQGLQRRPDRADRGVLRRAEEV
ncbi:MAG: cytochrome c subunit of flavocytochrome c sulfide dehydrogenase, partial [uncultured Ramlibacter sp.]